MNYYLFRKLEYDDKKYYQFYQVAKDFKPNDDFTTFDKRNEKEFFYVREDKISIDDNYLHYIFEDADGTFKSINDVHLLSEIYDKFKEKYDDLKDTELNIIEIKDIDEVVSKVDEKVKYQKDNIRELIKQIYRNQQIMASDLPIESKRIQKNNILFYGPKGHGKKEITKILGEELNIPYAYIEASLSIVEDGVTFPTVDEMRIEIAKQLLNNSNNYSDLSSGIVFIREDDDEKMKVLKEIADNQFEDVESKKLDLIISELGEKFSDSFIDYIGYVMDAKPFKYRGRLIDFSTLTFVISYDRDYPNKNDDYDISRVLSKSNCDYIVPIKELTNNEKIAILTDRNGLLAQYRKYLSAYGKKLMVSRKAIEYLVKECNKINSGMDFLNKVVEHIIKFSTSDHLRDVYINYNCVIKFCREYLSNDEEEIEEENVIIPEIKPIYEKLKEKILGQDKGLKNLLYNIIENRRMANRDDLEDSKQYIKNILIRGESGGGKTFIITNIAKILNIPCYIADATQYTEAGYVGADVTDMLVELYHRANNNIEEAQKGILVIDEIDKKATDAGRGTDVSRGAVLNSLLKIIEGAEITIDVGTRQDPEVVVFDTSKLTVICSGAFEGIEDIRDQRIKKMRGNATMGFSNAKEVPLTIDSEVIDKDFVEFGMMRQFMARFPVIVNLEKNTKESLISIMINSTSSALLIEKERLHERGIELEFTDDFLDKLAEEAMKLNIGVRGIDKVLQKVLSDINIQDIDSNDVNMIILNGDVITDASKVFIVPRQQEKVLEKVNKKN